MRILVIAGEASGDAHAAAVVRALRARLPEVELFGIGGDAMQAAGVELLVHARDTAVLGFAEIVRRLPFLRRVQRRLRDALVTRRPDLVLLVDYPGFNIPFARHAHALGVPVYYYVSPQVWAWKASRIRTMRTCVDRMFVVFPFEAEIYTRAGIAVEFVGHPLIDRATPPPAREAARAELCARVGLDAARPVVALFPGSRVQEIARMLPLCLDAARDIHTATNTQFVLAAAPTVPDAALDTALPPAGSPARPAILRDAGDLLTRGCDVALAKSGTTTLELAVAGTPMVVCYRTSLLSYAIGRAFATVSHIAMPNILAGTPIVPEFVQGAATAARLAAEVIRLLRDADARARMRVDLHRVRAMLGTPGAARRVAEAIAAAAPAR